MTMPDVSGLPENLDATYADDTENPSRKAHQQHHDTVHAAVKALLPRTEASSTYATKAELDAKVAFTTDPNFDPALYPDGSLVVVYTA